MKQTFVSAKTSHDVNISFGQFLSGLHLPKFPVFTSITALAWFQAHEFPTSGTHSSIGWTILSLPLGKPSSNPAGVNINVYSNLKQQEAVTGSQPQASDRYIN